MLPVASECFAQDGVVRFLEALRLLVESGEVPLHDGLHPDERFILFDGPRKIGNNFGVKLRLGRVTKHLRSLV